MQQGTKLAVPDDITLTGLGGKFSGGSLFIISVIAHQRKVLSVFHAGTKRLFHPDTSVLANASGQTDSSCPGNGFGRNKDFFVPLAKLPAEGASWTRENLGPMKSDTVVMQTWAK